MKNKIIKFREMIAKEQSEYNWYSILMWGAFITSFFFYLSIYFFENFFLQLSCFLIGLFFSVIGFKESLKLTILDGSFDFYEFNKIIWHYKKLK